MAELQSELNEVRDKLQEAEKASQATGKDAPAGASVAAVASLRDRRRQITARLDKSRDQVMPFPCALA